jgi:serine protease Do
MPRRALHRGLAAGVLAALAALPAVAAPAAPRERSCTEAGDATRRGSDFAAAVARQAPAVVSVMTIGQGAATDDDDAPQSRRRIGEAMASASGFVIASDGYILTSAHVVAGAFEVTVRTADQRRFPADVIGLDRRSDVAVLKIAASNLPVAAVGGGARLCPGEWVAALGAPFGFEQSVAAGVVSANPRFLPGGDGTGLIQTDVALNPGNSGGPLLDGRGEVVGMNTMIYSESGSFSGLSFSLPVDTAMRIAAELRATGRVTRGQIGARIQALTPELAPAFGLDVPAGALVVRLDAAGPAALAGLRSGDVLLAVEGASAMGFPEIQARVASARPGSSLVFSVWRRGAPLTVRVAVVESPPDLPQRPPPGAQPREPRLGLELVERTARQTQGLIEPGLYVKVASGPARRAGLRFGDLVLGVNDTAVASLADFDAALAALKDGGTVALLVRRGAATSFVPVRSAPPARVSSAAP